MSANDRTGAALAAIDQDARATGLTAAVCARNLQSGTRIGLGADDRWSLASVVKLPVALVAFDLFAAGALDPARPVVLNPEDRTPGPTGLAVFRHPAILSAYDLVGLALNLSDNAATDALLDLIGLDIVNDRLRDWGLGDLVLRHPMRAIYGAAEAIDELGAQVATAGYTHDGGHHIAELDPRRSNAGTPRSLVNLLTKVWLDQCSVPEACADLRQSLSRSVMHHRLGHELMSDRVTLANKTGTFGGLRHDVGVVDLGDQQIAMAVLTKAHVPARVFQEADWMIGRAARLMVDVLRA